MLPINPELFVFDKDGTLIDVHHYWISMTKLRVSVLKNFHHFLDTKAEIHLLQSLGVNTKTNTIFPNGPTGVKPREYNQLVAENCLREFGLIRNFKVKEAFLEADSLSQNMMSELIKPLPGAIQLIDSLALRNIPVAVISNDIHSRVFLALTTLDLLPKVALIIGGDDVKNSKPCSDMLLKAINYFQCDPSGVVNIGDHPNDIRMGLASNVKHNIAVLTGLNTAMEFENLNCKIVKNLSDVIIKPQ